MDLLIDLIILLIKRAAKPRQPAAPPLPAPQQTGLAQQIQAMQAAAAQQQSRVRIGRKNASRSQPAAPPPIPPPAIAPLQAKVATLSRGAAPSSRMPAMKGPFILGEVLSKPIALRDEEW